MGDGVGGSAGGGSGEGSGGNGGGRDGKLVRNTIGQIVSQRVAGAAGGDMQQSGASVASSLRGVVDRGSRVKVRGACVCLKRSVVSAAVLCPKVHLR
jgi:hypothetical protein